MIHRTTIVALLLTSAAASQSPLTTTFTSNGGGSPGGQALFDLSVATTVTITRLDVNVGDTPGTVGAIEIYMTPTTHVGVTNTPGAWTLVGRGSVTAQGIDTPSPLAIPAGIVMPPGSYGVAIRYIGVSFRRTSGSAIYSTAELTLTTGGVQLVPWGTYFVPRQFNGSIHYLMGTVAGPFVLATTEIIGTGCSGMTLQAIGSPLLGATVTMRTGPVAPTAVLGGTFYGITPYVPGIPLTMLGSQTCLLHVDPLLVSLDFSPSPTFDDLLTVPVLPQLLGVAIYSQSAVLDPGITPGGLATSNAVKLTIGNA